MHEQRHWTYGEKYLVLRGACLQAERREEERREVSRGRGGEVVSRSRPLRRRGPPPYKAFTCHRAGASL